MSPVRGKCRHCDRSVRGGGWGWASEGYDPYPYECGAAPEVVCPPCSGRGRVPDEHRRDEAGRPVMVWCGPCEGQGWVPGPHWPWRHPPTAL